MFLLVSVILSTGGVCLSACWDTPPEHTPREQTPSRSRHPPGADTPPGIRSMSGRYASYWNAFLFISMCTHKKMAYFYSANLQVGQLGAIFCWSLNHEGERIINARLFCLITTFILERWMYRHIAFKVGK